MSESNWKSTVYVGGLTGLVTEANVLDAFIPFGDITQVTIPKGRPGESAQEESTSGPQNRGFAYVEFEEADDAKEAVDNMDGAELFGKTLKCSLAKAPKSENEGLGSKTALWDQEGWLAKESAEGVAPDPVADDPMQGLEQMDVAGPKRAA